MLKCKECGEKLSRENYIWKYACKNPNCKLLGIYINTRKQRPHKPEVNSPSLSQKNTKEDGFPPTPKGMGILWQFL